MKKRKVNIIILNYNGKHLLEKYLGSAVEASKRSSHDCSVSVIDNKSTDDSAGFVDRHFPEVVFFKAKENKVLCSFNEYLKVIDDDICIFLNNDIRVDPDFVDPLIGHFVNEDILFVAPKELNMEGVYQGNLNKIRFRFGILSSVVKKKDHARADYTTSVHSGAFDREKFLYLDGYDDMYLPGINEDLDLCYRGWKHGWKGIYEPKSFYYHEGSTSFDAEHGYKDRMLLAHRNNFLFFWKNVTSTKLMFLHVVSIPPLLCAAFLRAKWLFIKGFFRALLMARKAMKRKSVVVPQFRISDEEAMKRISG